MEHHEEPSFRRELPKNSPHFGIRKPVVFWGRGCTVAPSMFQGKEFLDFQDL